jgi:hypothetical protein
MNFISEEEDQQELDYVRNAGGNKKSVAEGGIDFERAHSNDMQGVVSHKKGGHMVNSKLET